MAELDLYALQKEKGGTVSRGGTEWRGPGPGHSKWDTSLTVTIKDGRPLIHSFAGDDFRDCAVYLGLERSTPLDQARQEELRRQRNIEREQETAWAIEWCAHELERAVPIRGTQAADYLVSRGLDLECLDLFYHPGAPRDLEEKVRRHPAMVAAVRDLFGRIVAIHCTYLRDGQKAFGDRSRLLLCSPNGGAVRLCNVPADGVLAIGEGIETSRSYQLVKGVPTWAALSTSGVQNFNIPLSVKHLVTASDGDGPGRRAAEAIASRVRTSPARDRVTVGDDPAPDRFDWNDVLQSDLPA